MAFVVVQHLDPSRHSSMPEILSRLTRMPVHVAGDGMKVQPNTVYLIPPDKNVGIEAGSLYLRELMQPRGLRLPVDFFLRSLANERGPDGICVILSGSGTDGTLGLRAVKAEAGMAIAQDPDTARYDGMPRSAIETGLVDFVLRPDRMPATLIDYVKHYLANSVVVGDETEDGQSPMQQIFAALRTRTGHDFSRYKQSTIRRRLQRRMSVNSIEDVSHYARLVREDEAEAKALLKDILISVTSFFRDPGAFDALKKRLKLSISSSADLRVWVAGCATGEEAYSIAMVVAECLGELQKGLPVQVYATDIDGDAMSIARRGVYPANIAADVTPERLERFFIKDDKSYRVKKELRDMVVFAPQDIIKDPPFSKMDLICCRNLLIYLESDVQKQLVPLLHYALKPGGLLFLGTSESIGEATDLFAVLDKKWRIYQRREVAVSPARLRFPAAFTPRLSRPGAREEARKEEAAVPALTEKHFLDRYAPAFAVVDEKDRLVYVRGRTGKYLEITSGQPSLSILDMAREGLRTELASALYRAASEKKAVVHEGVRVKHNGGFQTVNLTVAPVDERGAPPGLLMVVFQEVEPSSEPATARPVGGRAKESARLQEELKLTREHMQSLIEEQEVTNEELKSANEELQSNNEELQSTNEELDTSSEELQSVNEEMVTVNAELSAKTDMLARANDDLKNYLNRTDIAIIFLDEDLRIRSFTPAVAAVFNIKDIDIDRPLPDITSRLAYEGTVEDSREVLRTLAPKEIEVQRRDGHWYNMRILPYLTVQNAVSGLVVSFLDIDKQKRTAEVSRLLATVVEDSNDAITTQDLEGRITSWNRGAERMYGYSEAEALKMNSAQLAPPEGRAQALQFLQDVKGGKDITSLEVKRQTRDGRTLDIWMTITRLLDDSGRPVAVATTERDVTERNRTSRRIELTNALLHSFLARRSLQEFLDEATRLVRDWSGCACAGTRVLDDLGNIPYVSHLGFDQDFLDSECWLSIKADHCACIRVITGAAEPQDVPMMTAGGSFCCNDTLRFVEGLTEAQQARYRGVCVKAGYRSVGIFPLRYRDKILGAIHLADRAAGKLPPDIADVGESAAILIGEAVQRFNLEGQLIRQLRMLDMAQVLATDMEGRIAFWSQGAETLYGFSKEEALGKVAHELLKTSFPEPYEELKQRVLTSGRWEGELLHPRRDGTRVAVASYWLLYRDAASGVASIIEENTDITERNRLQEEREQLARGIAQEQSRIKAILGQAPTGIVVAEAPSGRVILSNDQASNIWRRPQISSEDVAGYPDYQGFHPDGRPYAPEEWPLARTIAEGETVANEEIVIVRGDGTMGTMLASSQPIKDDAGNIIAGVLTIHDITDLKLARIKDEFIGMVSHELKQPLTVMIGALSVAMDEGVPQEEAKLLIQDAASSAESLADIVDDLLEMSRFQAKRAKLNVQRVHIETTASEVIRKLSRRSALHRLTSDFPRGLAPVAMDRVRIERVLHNLVENAIKYSPKGGEVSVFARQEGDELVVGVKDQGIGISLQDHARLFQNFERLHADTERTIGGIGLGLIVCRTVVEAHGGRIWAESEPGKGSTFYFSLPVAAAG